MPTFEMSLEEKKDKFRTCNAISYLQIARCECKVGLLCAGLDIVYWVFVARFWGKREGLQGWLL